MDNPKKIPETAVSAVIRLGKLSLQFGRTKRATYHEDRKTPESDTDHTVMLSMVACAFAKRFTPTLDIGKIAQYALIHDLVEVYAGDTPTLRFSTPKMRREKVAREQKAFLKIEAEFKDELPWVPETIREYESLKSPEARFVKTIDKSLPGITHLLNGGITIHELGQRATALDITKELREVMANTYGEDQSEALGLFDEIIFKIKKEILS